MTVGVIKSRTICVIVLGFGFDVNVFLNFFATIMLVPIAEPQVADTNLEFPPERLEAWVEFLERVPLKFGMHRDCRPTGSKDSFYVSRHGLLGIMSQDGYRLESIQNSRYNAQIRVNSNGSYALVKVGETLQPTIGKNLFHNVSGLGNGLFIPDLIAKGHLKLLKVGTVGKNTRYDFVPNGDVIPKAIVGVSLEFDADFVLPIMAESRLKNENQELFQRTIYSDFQQVDGEWLPSQLGGGIGDSKGYFREVSCGLSYDSIDEFGPERFLLSFYGIEEPTLAEFGDHGSRWLWILITAGLCGLVLGFRFFRRKVQ